MAVGEQLGKLLSFLHRRATEEEEEEEQEEEDNNNNNNNVSRGVRMKNLLIIQSPPFSYYFLPIIMPECLPQHPF